MRQGLVAGVAIAALAAGSVATRGLLLRDGGARAATHRIEMRHFAFSPVRLEAESGDTVVWVNGDVAPHTATAADGGWDSGNLGRGGSWAWIAAGPAEHDYVCAYHPSMRGAIVVRGAD